MLPWHALCEGRACATATLSASRTCSPSAPPRRPACATCRMGAGASAAAPAHRFAIWTPTARRSPTRRRCAASAASPFRRRGKTCGYARARLTTLRERQVRVRGDSCSSASAAKAAWRTRFAYGRARRARGAPRAGPARRDPEAALVAVLRSSSSAPRRPASRSRRTSRRSARWPSASRTSRSPAPSSGGPEFRARPSAPPT